MQKSLLVVTALGALALGGCASTPKETAPVPAPVDTTPTVASLCSSAEKVLFNCLVGSENKTLSICASSDLSASTGYLQYRYGVSQGALDLSLPANLTNTQAAFKLVGGALSFSNGTTNSYQVNDTGVQTFWSKAPERNRTLSCTSAVTNNLSSLSGIVQ